MALGVMAAEAMLGRSVVLARQRGQLLEFPGVSPGMVTTRPSSILRVPDKAARHQAFAALVRTSCAPGSCSRASTRPHNKTSAGSLPPM